MTQTSTYPKPRVSNRVSQVLINEITNICGYTDLEILVKAAKQEPLLIGHMTNGIKKFKQVLQLIDSDDAPKTQPIFPPRTHNTPGDLVHLTHDLCKLEDDHIARLILRTNDPRFIKWGKDFIAANLPTEKSRFCGRLEQSEMLCLEHHW